MRTSEYPPFVGRDLREMLAVEFRRQKVEPQYRQLLRGLLETLRVKHVVTRFHYDHTLRVTLTLCRIARFLKANPRPYLFSGLVHDIGKENIPIGILGESGEWTPAHQARMRSHVMLGYWKIADVLPFSAAAMVWHHRFQEHPYPARIPTPSVEFGNGARVEAREIGRHLAMVDLYDALHRDRFVRLGEPRRFLTGEEIRDIMLIDASRRELVEQLYDIGIFTTELVLPTD